MERRFSEWEDGVIITQVKRFPTNLQNAFKEAFVIIADNSSINDGVIRSIKAIEVRWYNVLKKKPSTKAIFTGSSTGHTQNIKNIARDKDGNMPDQQLKPHLWLMKELLLLDPKLRAKIVDFLIE